MKMKTLCNWLVVAATPNMLYAADGDLDLTFGVQGKQTIAFDLGGDLVDDGRHVVVAPDGKMYLIGAAQQASDRYGIGIARLDPNGSPDLTFGVDTPGRVTHDEPAYDTGIYVLAAAAQPDGKLVVAGMADIDPGQIADRNFAACRFNPDGTVDDEFGDEATPGCAAIGIDLEPTPNSDFATSLVIQSDGKIVLAGVATLQGLFRPVLARLTADGVLDKAEFGDGGIVHAFPNTAETMSFSAVAQAPDGKIVAVGSILTQPGNSDFLTAVFNPDGSSAIPDPLTYGFDQGGPGFNSDEAKAVHIYPDGTVLIAGNAQHGTGNVQMGVVKYKDVLTGTFDNGFDSDGAITHIFCEDCTNAVVNAVHVQSDGKIVLAGSVSDPPVFHPDFGIMRLDPDGQKDDSFGGGVAFVEFDLVDGNSPDAAYSIASQSGRLIIAGTAATPGQMGSTDFAVARLENDLIFADDLEGDGQ